MAVPTWVERESTGELPPEGSISRPGCPNGVNVMTPTMTWTKLARRLGSDRNPLRRRSDRLGAWLVPVAIAVFLALSPFVTSGAASWVHADITAARHAQRSWHRVSAVLLAAAPGPMMAEGGNHSDSWLVWTPARWTAGGGARAGRVPAAAGSWAGSTVPVWLDSAGKVQLPPLTAGQVRGRVVAAASAALIALAVLLGCVVLLIWRLLDRRRLSSWETAWLSVGPQWSRRG